MCPLEAYGLGRCSRMSLATPAAQAEQECAECQHEAASSASFACGTEPARIGDRDQLHVGLDVVAVVLERLGACERVITTRHVLSIAIDRAVDATRGFAFAQELDLALCPSIGLAVELALEVRAG